MIGEKITHFLDRIPYLERAAKTLSELIHRAVLQGGDSARDAADFLHGTWLGHPLHPALTDVVIGAWSLGALFDLASIVGRSDSLERTADTLNILGSAAAIPTAISGLADYSTIPNPAAGTALVHAVCNDVALTLYLFSAVARKQGDRRRGILLSALGMGASTAGAYLGGHLVYTHKVGVKRTERRSEPTEWTAVMNERDLLEQTLTRVDVEGNPVLLLRRGTQIRAIGAVCPHAGAPLEEGAFSGHHVQCPWHDSVFDLRDGRVVHGPSTYAVACYQARIHEERVEVRLAPQ